MNVTFTIADDIPFALKASAESFTRDVRFYSALMWYRNNRLTLGKATELAGYDKLEFIERMKLEGVPLFECDDAEMAEKDPTSPLIERALEPMNRNLDKAPSASAPTDTPQDTLWPWTLNDEEQQVWEAMPDFRKRHPLALASLDLGGDGDDAVKRALMEENRELWRRLRLLRDAMRFTDWLLLHYDYPEMKDWFDD